MRRILVTGMKEPLGGVESVVMGYIRQFDHAAIQVDVAVFGASFSLSDEIEAFGGRVWYLPSRRRAPFAYKKALQRIFKETTYDAVWCNFSGLTNIDFLKEAKKAEVLVRIAHAHTADFAWGSPLMRYAVPLLHRKNQRVLYRFATHFWSCSEAASAFMFGADCRKKVSILCNAIDTNAFAFDPHVREKIREKYGLTTQPVILHIGRMCTAKNQKFVLDIFKSVLQKQADARLLFVGDGELHEEIDAYAQEIGVSQAVIFTGALEGTAQILQAGDVFLLPSLTEGFPVTVMEAQAAGLYCVVSAQAVPQAVNVSDNVVFLSLEDPASLWAETLLSVSKCRDVQAALKVKNGGYDIKTRAADLQAFFNGKKIGIVTFPRAINYGTALQAIALQEVLTARGALAYFADHICEKIENADKLFDYKRLLNAKYAAAHLLNLPTAHKRMRRFREFAELYMRFGRETPQDADIMVAGSDQIWNAEITGNDMYYFLDFPKRNTKKAAYAASFGVSAVSQEYGAGLRGVLLDFDCLSVREQQAADIVKTITEKEVPVVLDPTFLLKREDWIPYMAEKTEGDYIFVYTVFNSESIWAFAEKLSRKTGLPIKTVSYSTLHKHGAVYDYTADPGRWLRYIADAAYVVTNSFHGVAFSVNFEKQFFYELPPASSGVGSRLSHITERYGLTHRAITEGRMDERLSFDAVRTMLADDLRDAQAFLDVILNL